MKLKFIANACCIYESDGKSLLCDPWLTYGAFGGSWFHFPALKTKPEDVKDCDYLYLSHIHPDHYDPATLVHFRRDIPIIALDHGQNYLLRFLERDGFTNVIKMKNHEVRTVGPFIITMFAPFCRHPFFESEFGNPLDSSIMVEADGHTVLNTNDNTPSPEAAKLIHENFKNITVAQLNYNCAGPYPSCFSNLKDKLAEHNRILERNLLRMNEVAEILNPDYLMPFAGDYVIGGKEWEKNNLLGTTTQEIASAYSPLKPLVLNEGQTFDLKKGQADGIYVPIDIQEQKYYIKHVLSQKEYPYEIIRYDSYFVEQHMRNSLKHLMESIKEFGVNPDCHVIIEAGKDRIEFDMAKRSNNMLKCTLDPRLLKLIMMREEHWNNAEIGCHINFEREPNIYQPDVHMLMSFFHL